MAVVDPAESERVSHPVDPHSETASSCFLLLSICPPLLPWAHSPHVNAYWMSGADISQTDTVSLNLSSEVTFSCNAQYL